MVLDFPISHFVCMESLPRLNEPDKCTFLIRVIFRNVLFHGLYLFNDGIEIRLFSFVLGFLYVCRSADEGASTISLGLGYEVYTMDNEVRNALDFSRVTAAYTQDNEFENALVLVGLELRTQWIMNFRTR